LSVEALVARYGLGALVVGAALEGETVAMIGGMLAHRGIYPLPMAWAAIFVGTFAADQGFFLAGRLFRDHPRMVRLRATATFARAQAMFEKRPVVFVLLFRFLYGLRTASPAMIGASGFPPLRFFLLNGIAAVVWSILFVGLGYAFGLGLEEAFGRDLKWREWLPYLLVPVAFGIAWKAISRRRRNIRR
jgi:membrane protein DedA with SNARE-associated domain